MNWSLFFSAVPFSGLALCLLPTTLLPTSYAWAQSGSSGSVLPVEAAVQSASLGQRDAYVLGPGDRIQLTVFNVPEFSGSYTVLVDGTLNLPWLGTVDMQGLTLGEATELLTQRYGEILTRPPQVTVALSAPRPVRVVVAGAVRRPGSYDIGFTDGAGISWPTLTQVIQASGGVTSDADVRRIQVVRPGRFGRSTVMEANLWDLIQLGDLAQDIRLRDGDQVIVAAAVVSPEESLRIATANFSPDNISVQVAGEVPRGGSLELPVNASLNQAILAAGGLDNPRLRSSAVELVRLNRDGTVLRRTYEIDLSAHPNDETNPILRADDVIIVGRNTLAQTTDWLNVLSAPFFGISAFLRLFGL